jgi:prephenate dehydrogenase
MRVAFLGLGLIGGSIARALRVAAGGGWSTTAWTPRGAGPRAALAAGAIDDAAGTLEGAVDGADLVVLAAPPTECLALLDELAGPVAAFLGTDAVVTDTASTKGAIVHHATTLGLRFVGGHPMAGRETTGFSAADPMLFHERPWVVVPGRADADAIARVESLARACGANPFTLDGRAHDSYVAAISHMPLVVSAALVEAVAGTGAQPRSDWAWAEALAAGGWDSMTRLARGDATMGAGIATTNPDSIASRLRDVRAVLDEWIALLEAGAGPDEPVLHERFAAARARLLAGDA